VKGDDRIRPAARNIFVNRLPNARFELGEIARQIDHNVALLSVHRVELDAKPGSSVIGLGATVSSHAPHNLRAIRTFIAEKRAAINAQASRSYVDLC
jgi:hypothetical protein